MKIFKWSLIVVFIVSVCSCGSNDETIVEEEEIEVEETSNSDSPLVRSIDDGFEINFEYVNGILMGEFGEDDHLLIELGYTYNSEGNVINHFYYSVMQPPLPADVLYTYIYNESGQLISFNDNQGEHADLTYQENQVIVDYGSLQVLLELDTEGRVIRLETPSYFKNFSYDNNGNLILNEEYDSLTNTLTHTYQYEYDTNNNPFFNQLQSLYLLRFVFEFAWSGSTFQDSVNFDFPYLLNNLTSITLNGEQIKTFSYTYITGNRPVTIEEQDLSDGSTKNYTLSY